MIIQSFIAYLDEDGLIENMSPAEQFEATDTAPIEMTLQVLSATIEAQLEGQGDVMILFGLTEDDGETLH